MGVVVFALSGCGSTTIDLNKYVTIEAEGYDSMGTLNCTFDYEAFEKDYDGKIKANVKSNDGGTAADIALELAFGEEVVDVLLDYCMNYQLDRRSELSNGDVVNLKWDCEDEDARKYFNVQLKYSDIQYTVKGLTEVGTFDPFEYVAIEFSGTSPDGTAVISENHDKTEMQYISVSADRSSGLSNGDKVTVTAGIQGSVDSFVEQFSTIPQPLEKEFIVEGLPAYVSSVAEISAENLDAMKQTAEDAYKDLVDNRSNGWLIYWGRDLRDELVSFTYLGNYFLARKDTGAWGAQNSLYLVYKADVVLYNPDDKGASGIPGSYYYFVKFDDLTLNGDGTLSVDLDNYQTPSRSCYLPSGYWIDTEFDGYNSLDDLYADCVQSVQDYYTFESNVSN